MLESLRPTTLNKREAEIIILEEGPGNKARNCWYGQEALESGKEIFRGCQVYADHPSKSEQQDLPERSIRDIIGRIKETYIVMGTNGKSQLRGVLKIKEGTSCDWVTDLIKESLQAAKEGFPPVAQVSIHADGDIAPRVIDGTKYNYVSKIKSAVSVDIVTKGGIKNSGFTNFKENALGGHSMTEIRDARFRGIQTRLAESLSNDDAEFLENYLQEGEEEEEEYYEEAAPEYGEELYEGDEEEPELFEDEEGNVFAATGEFDEDGSPVMMDEAGELFAMPQEEFEGDFAEADYAEEEPEYMDSYDEDYGEDYDVGIGAMADAYPDLANEINAEEMHTMESDRDMDIVALKMENKLLKSRMIAESKLQESGLPEGFVPIAELVGKSPATMDAIIDGRARMFSTFSNMVESSTAAVVDTTVLRESADGFVGVRILRNSLLPS